MIVSKIIPVTFLSIGIFLLMQVILPIASFKIWELGQKYQNSLLISPTNPRESKLLGISIQNKDNFPAIVSNLSRQQASDYSQFSLTIPKLNIEKATVEVDSNDLSKNLAHLPGSALPGEKGNIFISGHSAISPIFTLKKALFANLTDLKKGDQIIIEALGVRFKYEVSSLTVVDPNDLSVIKTPDNIGRYVSLMTCVPPGLNFKRLVVLGKMI